MAFMLKKTWKTWTPTIHCIFRSVSIFFSWDGTTLYFCSDGSTQYFDRHAITRTKLKGPDKDKK
jgi:hypothetical protein